jgi:hypothetical protein
VSPKTSTPTNQPDAAAADRRIFLPFGWFWPVLLKSVLVAIVSGGLIAGALDTTGALIFVIAALFVVFDIGLIGVIAGGLCRKPIHNDVKIAVIIAVLLKIILFLGAIVTVVKSLSFVIINGYVPYVLGGIHILPLCALARWAFGRGPVNLPSGAAPATPSPSNGTSS